MRRVVFWTSIAATVSLLVVTGVLTYIFLPEVESSLILAVVGIALAVVIPLGSSYYNQPNFEISVKDGNAFPNIPVKILKVKVSSKRNLLRDPRPLVTFETPGNTTGQPKIEISGKWDSAPEPVFVWPPELGQHKAFQGWLTRVERGVDILPGHPEDLAIAIKFQGEPEFYGFNSWSYEQGMKHPDYRIGGLQEVRVKVEVTSGDVTKRKWFIIENPNDELDPGFRLREDRSQKNPRPPGRFNRKEAGLLTAFVVVFSVALTLIGWKDLGIWQDDVEGAGTFIVGDFVFRWYDDWRKKKGSGDGWGKTAGFRYAWFFIVALVVGDTVLAIKTFGKIVYGSQISFLIVASWSVVLAFAVAVDFLKRYYPKVKVAE